MTASYYALTKWRVEGWGESGWFIVNDRVATRLHPVYANDAPITLLPGEAIEAGIKRTTNWVGRVTAEKTLLGPGQYFRRMNRPAHYVGGDLPDPEIDIVDHMDREQNHELSAAAQQLAILTENLNVLFLTVHPAGANLNTYGHAIRNLIILACTEVEAMWKGVMRANGVSHPRLNTNDYVKLNKAMRLNEYAVSLPMLPWIPESQPYVDWDATSPTDTLPWFNAYNALKHDREANFSQATLHHAINAVAACAIMFQAQGKRPPPGGYIFHKRPNWAVAEAYFSLPNSVPTATNYPF